MVALERIDDVLDHGSEEGIIKASREIFAHGWGRPTQPLEHGGPGGGPIKHTFDDVRRKLTELAAGAGVNGETDDDDSSDPGADTG